MSSGWLLIGVGGVMPRAGQVPGISRHEVQSSLAEFPDNDLGILTPHSRPHPTLLLRRWGRGKGLLKEVLLPTSENGSGLSFETQPGSSQ